MIQRALDEKSVHRTSAKILIIARILRLKQNSDMRFALLTPMRENLSCLFTTAAFYRQLLRVEKWDQIRV